MTRDRLLPQTLVASRQPEAGDGSPPKMVQDDALFERILAQLCHGPLIQLAALGQRRAESWEVFAVIDRSGHGPEVGDELLMHTAADGSVASGSTAASVVTSLTDDLADCCYDEAERLAAELYVFVPIQLSDGAEYGLFVQPARASEILARWIASECERGAVQVAVELERQLRVATLETELLREQERSALKEQLIAVLAHDLRDPLMGIYGWAETLVRHTTGIDVGVAAQRIQGSAHRMSGLIEDVLDFARGRLVLGTSGEMVVESDLSAALQQVVFEARAANPSRSIEATCGIRGAVRCDKHQVQQLLSNLLGNALRHGGPGHPVEVRTQMNGNELELAVSNQGAPIEGELLSKIFEPFWRPASSVSFGSGLGLGLHVCSQIAAAHGGRIEVSSTPEGVTRFVAKLLVGAPAIGTSPPSSGRPAYT